MLPRNFFLKISLSLLAIIGGFGYQTVLAQELAVSNAFIVSPAKQEIILNAGETAVRNVYITNHLGTDADFDLQIEDVSGSADQTEVVKYYGQGLGPYSLKNYLMIGADHIQVAAGDTKAVPIMISLPADAKPGGFYGGIFITQSATSPASNIKIATRAGSLIFLRVAGETVERGEVTNFALTTGHRLRFSAKPLDFSVAFNNTGNVYLNPYGLIEIKNIFGQVIAQLPIDPWYVFPDAVRERTITWTQPASFGLFTATLYLNHGCTETQTTVRSFHFFIFPLGWFLFLLIVTSIIYLFYRLRFKIKKWQI